MLGGIYPLARIVARLLLDHIDPMSLDSCPLAVDVVASLVLDRHQTVRLHIAGEELLAILPDAGLEHEDARGYANAEEQILRQLDDLAQTMVLENPLHLRL